MPLTGASGRFVSCRERFIARPAGSDIEFYGLARNVGDAFTRSSLPRPSAPRHLHTSKPHRLLKVPDLGTVAVTGTLWSYREAARRALADSGITPCQVQHCYVWT